MTNMFVAVAAAAVSDYTKHVMHITFRKIKGGQLNMSEPFWDMVFTMK